MAPSCVSIKVKKSPSFSPKGRFKFCGLSLSRKFVSNFLVYSFQIIIVYVLAKSLIPILLNKFPTCDSEIAPFYIYDIPYRFNGLIQNDCSKLHQWINMCPNIVNYGFGQPTRRPNWYATNQFTLELIFHARAVKHPCRTYDPESARLFYIPFYVYFYTMHMYHRAPNNTVRDAMAFELVNHLSNFSYFLRRGGHDHFIVGGGVVDLMYRLEGQNWFPATRLLRLPKFSNVSVLLIERQPWNVNATHFGVPYPSYFHPTTSAQMRSWQNEVRESSRNHLFAFIGGGRPGNNERTEILKLCHSTRSCLLMDCGQNPMLCEDSDMVMEALTRAHFCLNPRGDTWTRRSVFDTVLAGCIPVFFSENVAYKQYPWYIPKKGAAWSVLIAPEKIGQVEQVLAAIPEMEVKRMRETVIGMIPHVTYVHPNAAQIGFHDAVDVALIELTKRVDAMFNVSKALSH